MKSLFVVIFMFMAALEVSADCCGPDFCQQWGCCGKGSSNIFCCNCADGCKQLKECCREISKFLLNNRLTNKNAHDVAEQKFKSIDTDSNNQISLEEAAKYANLDPKSFGDKKWFTDMDKDNNGYISRSEFDETLS